MAAPVSSTVVTFKAKKDVASFKAVRDEIKSLQNSLKGLASSFKEVMALTGKLNRLKGVGANSFRLAPKGFGDAIEFKAQMAQIKKLNAEKKKAEAEAAKDRQDSLKADANRTKRNYAQEKAAQKRDVSEAIKMNRNLDLAQNRFNNRAGQLGGKLTLAQMDEHKAALADLRKQYIAGGIDASVFREKVSAISRTMSMQAGQYKTTWQQINGLRTSFVALTGAYTAFSAAMAIKETGAKIENINSLMRVAFGPEANSQMQFLSKTANELGINFLNTADNFSKFAFSAQTAGMSTKEMNEAFKGFSTAGVVLGRSREEMGSVFLALEQMMSMGTVQAQEMRVQLSNALPGAMELGAAAYQTMIKGSKKGSEAMVDFRKAMKAGSVDSTKFIQALSKLYQEKFAAELPRALQNFERQHERFVNHIQQQEDRLWKNGIRGIFTDFMDLFNSLMDGPLGGFAEWLVGSFEFIAIGITKPIKIVSEFINGLSEGLDVKMTPAVKYWVKGLSEAFGAILILGVGLKLLRGGVFSLLNPFNMLAAIFKRVLPAAVAEGAAAVAGGEAIADGLATGAGAAAKSSKSLSAFKLLGKTLGVALVAGLGLALYEWLTTTDFTKIGKQLGNAMFGLIQEGKFTQQERTSPIVAGLNTGKAFDNLWGVNPMYLQQPDIPKQSVEVTIKNDSNNPVQTGNQTIKPQEKQSIKTAKP